MMRGVTPVRSAASRSEACLRKSVLATLDHLLGQGAIGLGRIRLARI